MYCDRVWNYWFPLRRAHVLPECNKLNYKGKKRNVVKIIFVIKTKFLRYPPKRFSNSIQSSTYPPLPISRVWPNNSAYRGCKRASPYPSPTPTFVPTRYECKKSQDVFISSAKKLAIILTSCQPFEWFLRYWNSYVYIVIFTPFSNCTIIIFFIIIDMAVKHARTEFLSR